MGNCKYCNKEFKNVKNHEKHCKLNPDYDKIDHSYLVKNGANTYKYFSKLRSLNAQNNIHEHQINCKKCGKPFTIIISDNNFIKGKYKRYCSSSCANSRVLTKEIKEKISNSLHKNNNSSKIKFKICACCGK